MVRIEIERVAVVVDTVARAAFLGGNHDLRLFVGFGILDIISLN